MDAAPAASGGLRWQLSDPFFGVLGKRTRLPYSPSAYPISFSSFTSPRVPPPPPLPSPPRLVPCDSLRRTTKTTGRPVGSTGRLRPAAAGALHRGGAGALPLYPAAQGVLPAVPALQRGHRHGCLGGRAPSPRGVCVYSSAVYGLCGGVVGIFNGAWGLRFARQC